MTMVNKTRQSRSYAQASDGNVYLYADAFDPLFRGPAAKPNNPPKQFGMSKRCRNLHSKNRKKHRK